MTLLCAAKNDRERNGEGYAERGVGNGPVVCAAPLKVSGTVSSYLICCALKITFSEEHA